MMGVGQTRRPLEPRQRPADRHPTPGWCELWGWWLVGDHPRLQPAPPTKTAPTRSNCSTPTN